MKHIQMVAAVCLLCLPYYPVHAQRREVRVTASRASVYDAPRTNAQVLGELSRGKSLQATGRTQDDWLEIESPSEISGWIFGELLRGDLVEASSVRVRSGPGVGFEGIGTLVKGDQIRRREVQGGWVAFEGTGAMRVWVERSMVSAPAAVDLTVSGGPEAAPVAPVVSATPTPSPSPSPVPEVPRHETVVITRPDPEPTPTPRVVQRVVVTRPVPVPSPTPSPAPPVVVPPRVSAPVVRAPTPVATPVPVRRPVLADPRPEMGAQRLDDAKALLPSGYRLVARAPQGKQIRLAGEIRPLGLRILRPADYRLLSGSDAYPRRTVAYLLAAESVDMHRYAGQGVQINGLAFWLVGVREPVIVVQSVHAK